MNKTFTTIDFKELESSFNLQELLSVNEDAKFGLDDIVRQKVGKVAFEFIIANRHVDGQEMFYLSSGDRFNLEHVSPNCSTIINLKKVNEKRWVNKFLESVNEKLPLGGIYIASVETYANRRVKLMNKYPAPLNGFVYFWDTILHRFLPKIKFSKRFYFHITKGKRRMLSRAEAFGRLYACGFEVIAEASIDNKVYFAAKKTGQPSYDPQPTYGPLVRLKRVGKDGEVFKVYKLRTMHPYAEYLQKYVFENNQLDEGGKFKDDFRVSPIGKILRKFWLDELPMFYNWLKGDMKLIGVRPLSNQYFNLYSKELQDKRTKTKPGLVPPFYADMPKTLEEIMSSELRYLDAYAKAPFRTDVKYAWLICRNIMLKGARSK
ncbi:sugar transferase [Litoribacter alkaliphilus]|uniref:Sugar transferase n=1 Tax=Litoribacter ruber TaxID=702568 RepID=A0AAP2CKM1_9BACT|nr:sugar transferase [Litoribacter alkaliphilus]MBS9525887.1 sugar transferase [Litoribacter alkaliphilus]